MKQCLDLNIRKWWFFPFFCCVITELLTYSSEEKNKNSNICAVNSYYFFSFKLQKCNGIVLQSKNKSNHVLQENHVFAYLL